MTMPTSEPVAAEMDASACDQQLDVSPTDFSTPKATLAISPSLNSAPLSNDSSSTSMSTSNQSFVPITPQNVSAPKPKTSFTRPTPKGKQDPTSHLSSTP